MCGFWIVLVMFSALVFLDKFVGNFVEKFLSMLAGFCCCDMCHLPLLSFVCGYNDVAVWNCFLKTFL